MGSLSPAPTTSSRACASATNRSRRCLRGARSTSTATSTATTTATTSTRTTSTSTAIAIVGEGEQKCTMTPTTTVRIAEVTAYVALAMGPNETGDPPAHG